MFSGIQVRAESSTNFPNLKEKNDNSKTKDENGLELAGEWMGSVKIGDYHWKLSWDKVKFSKGYRVYRSEDNAENFEIIHEITDKKITYFLDEEFEFGKNYYYKVTYIHGNNESADSTISVMNYQLDSDNDHLPDLIELQIGTDVKLRDTDKDGLTDGFEYNRTGTSPTSVDSDENGIPDGLEDPDGDQLHNLEEYKQETDPKLIDTDFDHFTDGEEVNKYHTDPLNPDTDNDKLLDGMEVEFDTDPQNPHTKDPQTLDGDLQVEHSVNVNDIESDQNITPTLLVSTNAANAVTTTITNIEGTDANIFKDLPGYLGAPFEFNTEQPFEEAVITFNYDEKLEGNVSEFRPEIYYYNEVEGLLEKVENQVYNPETNSVSVKVTHFSTYILLNGIPFEAAWNREMLLPSTDEDGNVKNIDVVFSIDSSGSMDWNDPEDLRKVAATSFVDKLREEDRSAVVDFDSYARTLVNLTTDKTKVKYAISNIDSVGGTNLYAGLNSAVNQIIYNGNPDHEKYIIFLTDGDGTWYESALTKAKANNIVVYTIGLGYGVNFSLLERIANETGGKFFFASDASNLEGIFDETAGDTIDKVKDSDNDGISDYHELNGYRIENGVWITTDPNKGDTDGDGLGDGEEATLSFVSLSNIPYYKTTSRPDLEDTDNDGIIDSNDHNPKKYDVSQTHLTLMSDLSYINLEKMEGSLMTDLKDLSSIKENVSVKDRIDRLEGWKIANAENSNWYDSGLGALALKRGDQIVLAYRGTEPELAGWNDILADIQLGLINQNHQIDNAQRFAVNSILENKDTNKLYVTGHSLGGYLAQKISYDIIKNQLSTNLMMFPWNEIKLKNKLKDESYFQRGVTFNAPGFQPSLLFPPIPVTALMSDSYDDKVKNYRIDGDMVSQVWLKFGDEITLDNLKVKDITGDADDEAIYGPHDIAEFYAHFLGK
jgi:hypothetical protein